MSGINHTLKEDRREEMTLLINHERKEMLEARQDEM
jgi:hypothetical protein